jgi:predicted NBD/HSP70 family sugar kinase
MSYRRNLTDHNGQTGKAALSTGEKGRKQHIAIDLGGTNLRAVHIDQQGHVYRHLQEHTAESAGRVPADHTQITGMFNGWESLSGLHGVSFASWLMTPL